MADRDGTQRLCPMSRQPSSPWQEVGNVDLRHDIEAVLVDLSELTITELRDCDEESLAPSIQRILAQIERPRVNIGSGPPGRAD